MPDLDPGTLSAAAAICECSEAPGGKALIDGMVHPAPGVRGVLPDDSDRELIGPDLRPGDVTPGRFTFTFDFTEETQP